MTKEQDKAIKFLELHTNFMGKVDKGRCIRIPEENFTKTKQSLKTVLNMLKEKDAEIEKKDKMIDLMAEYISNLDIDEDICKKQSDNNCDDINREVECKECIKQYFERKAKDGRL